MLYAYIGTDRKKARSALSADAEACSKKAGAPVERVTPGESAAVDIERSLSGGGLFVSPLIVILDELLGEPGAARDYLLAAMHRVASSPYIFFIFEEKPDAEAKKALKKHAEKLLEFDAVKKARDMSSFSVAESLIRGDKKRAWIAYLRALQAGNAPEAIHGALFWKAKDAFLKSRSPSTEIKRLVADLAELPHIARRSSVDLEFALELFLLKS